MFTKAIVKTPCKNLVNGLTSIDLGPPDYFLALEQHKKYIKALRECGLEVTILEANENYPDSTFVEDTALLTSQCAIITNPGAPSRKGEIIETTDVVKNFYSNIEMIKAPGTLEAGDVMMVGKHFFIGLSERTNKNGADQLISILSKYGFTASHVTFNKMLHFKSGASYLENNNLLLIKDFINTPEFQKYNLFSRSL